MLEDCITDATAEEIALEALGVIAEPTKDEDMEELAFPAVDVVGAVEAIEDMAELDMVAIEELDPHNPLWLQQAPKIVPVQVPVVETLAAPGVLMGVGVAFIPLAVPMLEADMKLLEDGAINDPEGY
ncbi:hypothetical protein B0A49_09758 [Cryomyces minteri]|nr:hypothetical protein B0A49_09758 [Cryomyces minteri]